LIEKGFVVGCSVNQSAGAGLMVRKTRILARSLFLSVICFCSATLAAGQIAGGLTETTNTRHGGNNYIVGTVYSPTGDPIRTRMNMRLISPTSGDILVTTDDSGRFVFSNVGSGVYTVVIDGENEFEPVRQEVEIVRARSPIPETYSMSIRLRPFENKSKGKKPSVISASNAGVPKRAMELYQQASKLAEEKDYQGAIEQLKLAVTEYPAFVNAHNQIGVLYLRLNDLEKADEALKAALKIKPDAYEPLINRAIALFRLARYKDAENVLRATLKAKAESSVAYYYLGRTLNKMGRNDEAEKAYLTCTKMSPGEFNEAHRLLAVIYLDRGATQRVAEELETYLKLVPTAPDAADLRKVIEQSKSSAASPKSDRKPQK
jgi:TolA-binding protein